MTILLGVLLLIVMIPLTLLVCYQWLLAGFSLLCRVSIKPAQTARTRFLVMIPAHDEEAGIASTLESLRRMEYPKDRYHVLVVADRCTDGTATVARSGGAGCLERFDGRPGKGAALAWGIQEAGKLPIGFDAVVIIDADTLADPALLSAFDAQFQAGWQIQQGYNYISNPWASPFTRIIAVTGVLRNGRYYAGKTALGLGAMLTGTGMCLGADVLKRRSWTAFSVGEDWELSVELLLAGEKICFNPLAKTFAKESQSLKQASHQRLRWASGRYAVMGAKVWQLVRRGMKTRSLTLIDSAVTLVAPNYSSQASLSLLCLAGGWMVSGEPRYEYLFLWATGLVAAVSGYFLLGVFSTESPVKALAGLLLVPVFLPWRLTIEILGMLGFGRRNWGKMARSVSSPQQIDR